MVKVENVRTGHAYCMSCGNKIDFIVTLRQDSNLVCVCRYCAGKIFADDRKLKSMVPMRMREAVAPMVRQDVNLRRRRLSYGSSVNAVRIGMKTAVERVRDLVRI